MIHTAEGWITEVEMRKEYSHIPSITDGENNDLLNMIIQAINEARLEAIKECAEILELETNGRDDALGIDLEEAILNLIKQIK